MDDLTQAVFDRQGLFTQDEDFDPLSDDFDPGMDEGPDNDQNDIVDLPIVAEMPEDMRRTGVFDVERFENARQATESLLQHNPGRRPVFIAILDGCREPQDSDAVAQLVEQAQAENRSVYSALTLCRMLERTGALRRMRADVREELVEQDGVEYREVPKQAPADLWQTTPEGIQVVESAREGGALLELLALPSEEPLVPIYQKVLLFCADQPRTKAELDQLVDDEPLAQQPRRYSNHFIELLESRDALSWHDGGWNTTELGLSYLDRSAAQ